MLLDIVDEFTRETLAMRVGDVDMVVSVFERLVAVREAPAHRRMDKGPEWAKRQLAAADMGFAELDNGLWKVDDPAAAQKLCSRLGSGHLRALIDRWLSVLPSPLTPADRRAGYRWVFSVRQIEIADTAVFDRPAAGRAWFEADIRDHVDLGRPDRVKVIFDRRLKLRGKHQTPARSRPR